MIPIFIGGSTKAQYRKKQSLLSDMSNLCTMTSEGKHVQEATLSVMSRAHTREIGTSGLIVDEWAIGVFFYHWRKSDSWQYSCVLLPGQIYGEERAQTDYAGYCCHLWLKTIEKIDPKGIRFLSCYFKKYWVLSPVGVPIGNAVPSFYRD